MITWQEWGYIIGGYLSGSVLYSYLLPKALKGIDITAESPDGNPGTANAFTCVGIPIGILVLCMELLKGYLPVHLALRRVDPARWSFALILAGIGVGCCLISAVVIRKHYDRYRGEQMKVRLPLHR